MKQRSSAQTIIRSAAFYACLLTSISTASAVEAQKCPIVPTPKVYKDSGKTLELPPKTREIAIVLGDKCTKAELYAAERLQTLVERRFNRVLPIRLESEAAGAKHVFLLGQRSTNTWLDRLCTSAKIDLNEKSPGPDGFVIECIDEPTCQIVLVGAGNPRGVIYGQFALFDLIRKQQGKLVMPRVSVRDWPSIAWRGRPHSILHHHLVPGSLDAYAWSRLNFTDVRDNPNGDDHNASYVFAFRKASMGLPPGVALDRPSIGRLIEEAHRRDMFVWGTVSCSAPQSTPQTVNKTFSQLIEMGVDGLWLSYDDSGKGNDPAAVIKSVIELGKKHSITGDRLAVTPDPAAYQHIDRPFTHACLKVPGFDGAKWFFTRVPCQKDLELTEKLGIRTKPAWWHNLVNFSGGFTHNADVAASVFIDQRPGYLNLQPLRNGWHRPTDKQLAVADKYTDTVALWGIVGGWPEEYQMGAWGIWAWNPPAHDWETTRNAIYGFVYGPAQVATAKAFDDQLASLKSLFHLPTWNYHKVGGKWPGRLKKVSDRQKALELIDQLETKQRALQAAAPGESCLEPMRLQGVYLEPMREALVYARKMATLDYPEYEWGDLYKRMIPLVAAGKKAEAQNILDQARPQVEKQLTQVTHELAGLKAIDRWAARWRTRVSSMKYWEDYVAKMKKKK